jgi:hypothetical protein
VSVRSVLLHELQKMVILDRDFKQFDCLDC